LDDRRREDRRDDSHLGSQRYDRCEPERIRVSRSSAGSVRVSASGRCASLHDLRIAEESGRGWLALTRRSIIS